MKQVLKLTLEDTKKMMDGAINKAIEIGCRYGYRYCRRWWSPHVIYKNG